MNVGVKESKNGGDRGYYLSAHLVNRLIATIFTAIVAIAGYMIVWAINDTQWKTEQEAKIELITVQMTLINTKVGVGILPIAEERIKYLERRIDDLERELRKENDRKN